MNPVISVVMANYNTDIEYLKASIDSIIYQTFTDFEFIIIDDCSTDSSLDFIKSYTDDRITLIENKQNLGLTKSLNIGIQLSKGKYIARMDSDDIALPTRFEKQVKFMDDNPDLIVCGTWFEKFGIENTIRKPIIENFEFYRCQLLFRDYPITVCHPSAMLRKSMLDEYALRYNEDYSKSQDYAMWADCSKFGRIDIIPEVLLRYRTHASQISTKNSHSQEECSVAICRSELSKFGIDIPEKISQYRNCEVFNIDEAKEFAAFLNSIVIANDKLKLYDKLQLQYYVEYVLERAIKNKNVSILKLFLFGGAEYKRMIIKLVLKKIR